MSLPASRMSAPSMLPVRPVLSSAAALRSEWAPRGAAMSAVSSRSSVPVTRLGLGRRLTVLKVRQRHAVDLLLQLLFDLRDEFFLIA